MKKVLAFTEMIEMRDIFKRMPSKCCFKFRLEWFKMSWKNKWKSFKETKYLKRIQNNKLNLLTNIKDCENLQIFTETLFGSYVPHYRVFPKSEDEAYSLINKMIKKYKTIIFLYCKPLLNYKSIKIYCYNLQNNETLRYTNPLLCFKQVCCHFRDNPNELSSEEMLNLLLYSLLILKLTVCRMVEIHDGKRYHITQGSFLRDFWLRFGF